MFLSLSLSLTCSLPFFLLLTNGLKQINPSVMIWLFKQLDYVELWFSSFLLNFILKSNFPLARSLSLSLTLRSIPVSYLFSYLFIYCLLSVLVECILVLSSIFLFVGELAHLSFDFFFFFFFSFQSYQFPWLFLTTVISTVAVCFLIIVLSCLLSTVEWLFIVSARITRCFCCISESKAVQTAHNNACRGRQLHFSCPVYGDLPCILTRIHTEPSWLSWAPVVFSACVKVKHVFVRTSLTDN